MAQCLAESVYRWKKLLWLMVSEATLLHIEEGTVELMVAETHGGIASHLGRS